MTKAQMNVLAIIEDQGPCTIVDLWNAGLERGKSLHEALRALEKIGHISNRLEFRDSPHRIYRSLR